MKTWQQFVIDEIHSLTPDQVDKVIEEYEDFQTGTGLQEGILRNLCETWQANLGIYTSIQTNAKEIIIEILLNYYKSKETK